MEKSERERLISELKDQFASIVQDPINADKLGYNENTWYAYKSYLKSGRKISLDKMVEVIEKWESLKR